MGVTYSPGSLVSARGREWVVLPDSEPDMLVLRPLAGTDDEVAAVFPGLETVTQASFPPPAPDDLGDHVAAGLLRTALRIGFTSSAGPLRSLASIAVEPRPYQLVPLLMALRQQTVRLAICDDVGIGKTVESGLIAKELLAQGEASGLAVLCSPALAEQWQEELRAKFGIDADLILPSTVPRLERALPYGASLFEQHKTTVISTDFIKSPRHRDDFIKHCPDLVIVDEAHACVPADGDRGGSAQLRYELLTRIAKDQARHLMLVSATPHSGKDESFRALIGLLEPALADVDLGTDAGRRQLATYYVQRRRADIRHYLKEDTEFPSDRQFTDAPYTLSPGYRALLDDAIAYASARVTGATGRREQRVAWWSAIALLRSLVSSPRAAAQTLATRSQAAAATTAEEADVLGRPVTTDMADDNPDGIDASPGADDAAHSTNQIATDITEPPLRSAVQRTGDPQLAALAVRAAKLEGPDGDRKLAELIKVVKRLLDDGYHPIVFCRYIPTSEYVAEYLDGSLGRKTVVQFVNGTLSPAQRLDRIEKLARATEEEGTRRVLIATDCLSEGVNLQHYFNAIVHYDLAWNPTRHEQREGRVDRFGQRATEVRVVTIFGKDNGIDGKVLEVLIKKHQEIRKSTGVSVPIPDETSGQVTNAIVEWLLMRGRGGQQALFGVEEIVGKATAEFEATWSSMTERETRSRSRFAQLGSIHESEVAREVAVIRAALGRDDEVRAFTRTALNGLAANITSNPDGGFTVTAKSLPAGLEDSIAALIGERPAVPFRTTPAVPRGEAALTRTDPVVGAVASFVLSAALDRHSPAQCRPARRCGVITTDAVRTRTTLLLVRYRYQMALPGRHGEVPLIAEDARVLGFEGAPARATWLDDESAVALLAARPDESTAPEVTRKSIRQVLDGLDEILPEVNRRGSEFADQLREDHRRVRRAADRAVRGLRVAVAGDADILGCYIYLPYVPDAEGAV
jgi:superfamily II DNA or RNA helicase